MYCICHFRYWEVGIVVISSRCDRFVLDRENAVLNCFFLQFGLLYFESGNMLVLQLNFAVVLTYMQKFLK